MNTPFSKEIFECMREHMIKSADPLAVCHDHRGSGIPFFVGTVQVFTNEMTTSPKPNATFAYPVHIVLFNCLRKYLQYLIDHRHTFIGFSPVYIVEQDNNSKIDNVVKWGQIMGQMQ